MSLNAAQLLKRLEPAIRPGATTPPSSFKPSTSIESQSFEQMLSLAKSGGLNSGRQIDLVCDPQPPLAASQLERLASAADQAEAAGSSRAVMLIDGRGFVLDVKNRTLLSEVSSTGSAAVQGVDAAFHVPAHDESLLGGTLKLPSALAPSSILKQLTNGANSNSVPL